MSNEANQTNPTQSTDNNPAANPRVATLNNGHGSTGVSDSTNSDDKDPVSMLIHSLTIGNPHGNGDGQGNPPKDSVNHVENAGLGGNPKPKGGSDSNSDDPTAAVIQQLLEPYKHQPIRADRDSKKFAEAIAAGDMDALLSEIDNTANAAVTRTLHTVLNLVPDIIETAVARSVSQAGSQTKLSSSWDKLVEEVPQFKDNKMVKTAFNDAIGQGASYKDAVAALKVIYGGLLKRNPLMSDDDDDDDSNQGGGAFNLNSYLNR